MYSSLISSRARQYPTAIAIIDGPNRMSFHRFNALIDATAHALSELLPKTPSIIGVDIVNWTQEWITTLAVARLGHSTVSASDAYARSLASVTLCQKVPDEPASVLVLTEDWWSKIDQQTDVEPVPENASWNDNARLVLSSGTTGTPKKVMLSHQLILQRIALSHLALPAENALTIKTRMYLPIRNAAIAGFNGPLLVWAAAGAMVLRAAPPMNRDELEKSGITEMAMTPRYLQVILDSMKGHEAPLEYLTIAVAGGQLTEALATRASAHLTPSLVTSYGSTEGGGITLSSIHLLDSEVNDVGFVLPWVDLEIVDEADKPLPIDQEGIVRIRGPEVVSSYYQDEVASAAAFREGWFYPGDVGALSKDGRLRIVGRSVEVLNFGGKKYSPDDLEAKLRGRAGILDLACFALPDKDGVNVLGIAAVRAENYSEAEFRRLISKSIVDVTVTVFFVESIPRNTMGKIPRSALAAAFAKAPQPTRLT